MGAMEYRFTYVCVLVTLGIQFVLPMLLWVPSQWPRWHESY